MARGKPIRTLYALELAAHDKRSVTLFCGLIMSKPCLPAAVAINWSGAMLLEYFNRGMYIYEKETKEET